MSKITNECFDDVIFEIDMILKTKDTVIVAIDGKSGSGKSRLASYLASEYDCNVFHMDDFFLTPEQRTQERLAEVGGNIDYERFEEQIIDSIMGGLDFRYDKYDCQSQTFENSEIVYHKPINVIEGVYSQHPRYRDFYDIKIFLTVDDRTQARRIYERDGEEKLKKFIYEWIPLENLYFEEYSLSEECDVVIDTSSFW